MKICRLCGEEKPFDDFYRAPGARDGYRGECKACNLARRRSWYTANRDREIQRVAAWNAANAERRRQYEQEYRASGRKAVSDRKSHLRRKFGLTVDQYEEMLAQQAGGCAICCEPPPEGLSLHVDHDHDTGEVRGLLCVRCNNGLGQLQEDVALLEAAIAYLDDPAADLAVRDMLREARAELEASLSSV